MTTGRGPVALAAIVLGAFAVGSAAWLAPNDSSSGELLVFTQIPSMNADLHAVASARIVALELSEPSAPAKLLTAGFVSAHSPQVSPDGRRVAFVGRKREADRAQIWELSLHGSRARQITTSDCEPTDPTYFSNNEIIFSAASGRADSFCQGPRSGWALYVAHTASSKVGRITYRHSSDLGATVLQNGLVLFVSSSSGDAPRAGLYTVRADGTGFQLFQQSEAGWRPRGRAWETATGEIVVVERRLDDSDVTRIVALSPRQPGDARVVFAPGAKGTIAAIAPLAPGVLVMSYRSQVAGRFELYELGLADGRVGRQLTGDQSSHAVAPVLATRRARPATFVSVVDTGRTSGWFYSLDADRSGQPAAGRTAALQVWTESGMLGETPVEADGSFYVELPANTPLRLRTLDAAGRVLRGPSDWIWLRPNEHRGCIGCHEHRELAPPNRVPLAIGRPAVVLGRAPTGGAAP